MRFLIFFAFLVVIGCTHPISDNMRATLDPSISTVGLFESPEVYVGKKVMLAGNIVQTRNFLDNTDIEVVQKGMDSYGNLNTGDATLGRFIFRHRGYLESEVYAKGRNIIGAGVVVGSQAGKIGERDYLFAVIEPEEINLLPEYPDTPYYNDPFYPYFFYGFSFGHHHHRHHHHRHRYW